MPPYLYIENDHFTEIPTHITKGEDKGLWRKGPTGENFKHENVLDELCTKVLEKIDEYKQKPFFIYFPMNAPHSPILPSSQFIGKSHTNEYGDFVLQCDDVMGRIMNKLEEENLSNDTIVIFTSDNGCSPVADLEELKAKGHYPNYIFRGHKADIYEGGHRIPYITRWSEGIKKGLVCNQTVCLSDFMATIADVVGYKLSDDMGVDSFSNISLWNGSNEPVRTSSVHQSCDGSLISAL